MLEMLHFKYHKLTRVKCRIVSTPTFNSFVIVLFKIETYKRIVWESMTRRFIFFKPQMASKRYLSTNNTIMREWANQKHRPIKLPFNIVKEG